MSRQSTCVCIWLFPLCCLKTSQMIHLIFNICHQTLSKILLEALLTFFPIFSKCQISLEVLLTFPTFSKCQILLEALLTFFPTFSKCHDEFLGFFWNGGCVVVEDQLLQMLAPQSLLIKRSCLHLVQKNSLSYHQAYKISPQQNHTRTELFSAVPARRSVMHKWSRKESAKDN